MPDRWTDAEFSEFFRGVNVKIGLRSQGHIPTVILMLAHGATWDEIGSAIGWHGPTVEKWLAIDCAREAAVLAAKKGPR